MATIVLVEPQHPGNVGAVARVMANFGCRELLLVGGCEIDDDAMARAKAGRPLLEATRRVGSLAEALADAPLGRDQRHCPRRRQPLAARAALGPGAARLA